MGISTGVNGLMDGIKGLLNDEDFMEMASLTVDPSDEEGLKKVLLQRAASDLGINTFDEEGSDYIAIDALYNEQQLGNISIPNLKIGVYESDTEPKPLFEINQVYNSMRIILGNKQLREVMKSQSQGDEEKFKKSLLKKAAMQLEINIFEESDPGFIDLDSLLKEVRLEEAALDIEGGSITEPKDIDSKSETQPLFELAEVYSSMNLLLSNKQLRELMKYQAQGDEEKFKKSLLKKASMQLEINIFEESEPGYISLESLYKEVGLHDASLDVDNGIVKHTENDSSPKKENISVSEKKSKRIIKKYHECIKKGLTPQLALDKILKTFSGVSELQLKSVIEGNHFIGEQKGTIDEIIEEIVRKSKFKSVTRTDAESAMLDNSETHSSRINFNRTKSYYANEMSARGGVRSVIDEIKEYLASNIGGDADNRSIDDYYFNEYAIALRGIMDRAPRSSFGNYLLNPEYQEQLAYYWLAATDAHPPATAGNLDSTEERSNADIENNKYILMTKVAEIRRAHNDGTYTPEDSKKDDPSCPPGTWGRIAFSVPSNPLTRMPDNPLQNIQGKMIGKIIQRIRGMKETDIISEETMTRAIKMLSRKVFGDDFEVPAELVPDLDESSTLKEDQEAYDYIIMYLRAGEDDIVKSLCEDFANTEQRTITMVSDSYIGEERPEDELRLERKHYKETAGEIYSEMMKSLDFVNIKHAAPPPSVFQSLQDELVKPFKDEVIRGIVSEHQVELEEILALCVSRQREVLMKAQESYGKIINGNYRTKKLEQKYTEILSQVDDALAKVAKDTEGIILKANEKLKGAYADNEIHTEQLMTLSDFSSRVISNRLTKSNKLESSLRDVREQLVTQYRIAHLERVKSKINSALSSDLVRKIRTEIAPKVAELNKVIRYCKVIAGHDEAHQYDMMSASLKSSHNSITSYLLEEVDAIIRREGLTITDDSEREEILKHLLYKGNVGISSRALSKDYIKEPLAMIQQKKSAVMSYQQSLLDCYEEADKLAKDFLGKVNDTIDFMQSEGRLSSKERQQLEKLEVARQEISNVSTRIPSSKGNYKELSGNIKTMEGVFNKLTVGLDEVGYPGKFKAKVHYLKDKFFSLLKRVSGISIKHKKLKGKKFFKEHLGVGEESKTLQLEEGLNDLEEKSSVLGNLSNSYEYDRDSNHVLKNAVDEMPEFFASKYVEREETIDKAVNYILNQHPDLYSEKELDRVIDEMKDEYGIDSTMKTALILGLENEGYRIARSIIDDPLARGNSRNRME